MKIEQLEAKLAAALEEARYNPQLKQALRGFSPLLPRLAELGEAEARAFFRTAEAAVIGGDVQVSNLAYDLRRRVQAETSLAGVQEAMRRQERMQILSDALAQAGAVGLLALRVFVKAIL